MSKAHYDALESLIPAGLNVYRGAAPIEPAADEFPYVVLGGSSGREFTEGLSKKPDALDLRFKLTYAALSFDGVLVIAQKVRAALTGAKLIVSGWNTDPLAQDNVVDVRVDFDITIPVVSLNPFYAVDELTAFSTR
jgi:hypothetical protein